MFSFVKSQLKSLDDQATPKQFGHLIDVMCNWGRADDVLEFVSENIESSVSSFLQPAPKKQTRGKVLLLFI